MPDTVYKVLLFMKRNTALSVEEFRHYYETVHAPFCAQSMTTACRYVRRYTDLVGAPHADVGEFEFDCITEIWFEDRETRDSVARNSASHDLGASNAPSELERTRQKQHLFDLSMLRVVTVDECDSTGPEFPACGMA